MGDNEAFGPRLRRERERRGISLEQIAADTKVGVDLWAGLERGDLARWPSGIFARAFVRSYAQRVGLNAQDTVDEFCRLFPMADRRAETIIRSQAETIGVASEYADDRARAPLTGDRRQPSGAPGKGPTGPRLLKPGDSLLPQPSGDAPGAALAQRTLAASLDVVTLLILSLVIARIAHRDVWMTLGVLALVYYSAFFAIAGGTPAALLIEFVRQRIVGLPPERHYQALGARR